MISPASARLFAISLSLGLLGCGVTANAPPPAPLRSSSMSTVTIDGKQYTAVLISRELDLCPSLNQLPETGCQPNDELEGTGYNVVVLIPGVSAGRYPVGGPDGARVQLSFKSGISGEASGGTVVLQRLIERDSAIGYFDIFLDGSLIQGDFAASYCASVGKVFEDPSAESMTCSAAPAGLGCKRECACGAKTSSSDCHPESAAGAAPKSARVGHQVLALDNRLLVFGGGSGSAAAQVEVAEVDGNGVVQPFRVLGAMPGERRNFGLVAQGRRLYLVGGSDGSGSPLRTVLTSQLSEQGELAAWTAGPELPAARAGHSLVKAGTHLYVVGGGSAEVYVAAIAEDGSLGAWSTTTPLPASRTGLAAVASRDRIYVSGGTDASGNPSNALLVGTLQPDGQVLNWEAGPSLNAPRASHAMAISGDQLVVAGGLANGAVLDSVEVLPTALPLGAWTQGPKLAPGVQGLALVAAGVQLYAVGGQLSASGANTDSILQRALLMPGRSLGAWQGPLSEDAMWRCACVIKGVSSSCSMYANGSVCSESAGCCPRG